MVVTLRGARLTIRQFDLMAVYVIQGAEGGDGYAELIEMGETIEADA